MTSENFLMIKTIAEGLGDIINNFVFTGGAVMELYVDDIAAGKPRMTDDVDVVVKAVSRALYDDIENNLRNRGFINDIYGPSCRFLYKNTKLDVITTTQNIGGFTNIWYEDGFKNSVLKKFDSLEIKIFSVEYFIASKLEAFKDRGKKDMFSSHDFEDIIYVLDGRKEIQEELKNSNMKVVEYFIVEFTNLLKDPSLSEGISANLGYGVFTERVDRIINIFKSISRI